MKKENIPIYILTQESNASKNSVLVHFHWQLPILNGRNFNEIS